MFRSILFEESDDALKDERAQAPDFFADLNLDQIINAITAGRDEYDLTPFFYRSLRDVDAVSYRHEVIQDLENPTLFGHVGSFAKQMRLMRAHLAQADKLYYKHQKQAWFLDAVAIYCDTINRLTEDLASAAPEIARLRRSARISHGLCRFAAVHIAFCGNEKTQGRSDNGEILRAHKRFERHGSKI